MISAASSCLSSDLFTEPLPFLRGQLYTIASFPTGDFRVSVGPLPSNDPLVFADDDVLSSSERPPPFRPVVASPEADEDPLPPDDDIVTLNVLCRQRAPLAASSRQRSQVWKS